MLRVVPTEEAGVFGWDPEFIVRSLTIVEQAHQGLLRVYEVGQAGPVSYTHLFCSRDCTSSAAVANELKKPEYGIRAPIFILEGGWDELRKEPSLVP